jgi:hypothetical protein
MTYVLVTRGREVMYHIVPHLALFSLLLLGRIEGRRGSLRITLEAPSVG